MMAPGIVGQTTRPKMRNVFAVSLILGMCVQAAKGHQQRVSLSCADPCCCKSQHGIGLLFY